MRYQIQRVLAAALLVAYGQLVEAGQAVTYTVDGLEYEGYYATPAKSRGLILLIHDWDGLTEYEEQRAEMLAGMGYSVFAADLFGKGVRPTEVVDKRQHTGELYQNREKMRALMRGAMATARDLGASGDAVAMGYCFGGAAVLELARSGEALKGFATFHGGLGTPEGQNYSAVAGKVLVYHGTADGAVTMEQFASLAEQLEAANVAHEMVTYSGTPHAFTVFGSPAYREEADRKSWESFTGFLNEQFKAEGEG